MFMERAFSEGEIVAYISKVSEVSIDQVFMERAFSEGEIVACGQCP